MRSDARGVLHRLFGDVPIGTRFHLVNTVMGAAVPGTPTYEKTSNSIDEHNARRVEDSAPARVRATQPIEPIIQ